MTLNDLPVAVLVWGMSECPACAEYIPRFRAVAERYGHCIPSYALNASQYERDADRFGIQSTPTTMVVRWGRPSSVRREGNISDLEIEQVFQLALAGAVCEMDDGSGAEDSLAAQLAEPDFDTLEDSD